MSLLHKTIVYLEFYFGMLEVIRMRGDRTVTRQPNQRTSRPIFKVIFGLIFILLIAGRAPLPLTFTTSFVPFEVNEPNYLPIETTNHYSNVVNLSQIKLVYENDVESLTIWATTNLGWNHVTSWDESIKLSDGSSGYYTEVDQTKMVSWQYENVEYAIDYSGSRLSKEELLKIASSIEK